MRSLADLRHEYGDLGLDIEQCPADPMGLFGRWFDDFVASGQPEPNAMILATVDASGQPSARTVLLKGVEGGFVFYTNYESRKAQDLAAHPRAALVFPWHAIGRQIRVEGVVAKVEAELSQAYFASRPRGSQLGAWASPQSQEVQGRPELETRFREAEQRFPDAVPLPPFWGGFRLIPQRIEFWQGRGARLHDRVEYSCDDASQTWRRRQLAP